MNPEDVPAELLDAVRDTPAPQLAEQKNAEAWARVILAAALPLHEKQVREQVAAEIEKVEREKAEAEPAAMDSLVNGLLFARGLLRAARIARGERS
jgi:hypothetical protein